jgi:hypothetical protein
MFLLQAVLVGLVIIAVENVRGILRTLLLVPIMGDLLLRPLHHNPFDLQLERSCFLVA